MNSFIENGEWEKFELSYELKLKHATEGDKDPYGLILFRDISLGFGSDMYYESARRAITIC